METSWSRRWNWEKPRRSKLIFSILKSWFSGSCRRGLWQSLCRRRGDPNSECTAPTTRPGGGRAFLFQSFSFFRASLSFKNLFFLQAGGQDLTEEEVAKLDLELEMELDDVNAENIDWIISSSFFCKLVKLGKLWIGVWIWNTIPFFCCCNPVCHLP